MWLVVLIEWVARNDMTRDLVSRTATGVLRRNAAPDLEQVVAPMVELEVACAGKDLHGMHRVPNMVQTMARMSCENRSTAAFGGKKG